MAVLDKAPVLDEETVGQLVAELPCDVLMTIIATFETDTAAIIEEMRAAGACADQVAFARGAHKLAGTAASFGARSLLDLARHCERQAGEWVMLPVLQDQARAASGAWRDRLAAAR